MVFERLSIAEGNASIPLKNGIQGIDVGGRCPDSLLAYTLTF